jgi:hypothetical protein
MRRLFQLVRIPEGAHPPDDRAVELGVPCASLERARSLAQAIHTDHPDWPLEIEVQEYGRKIGNAPVTYSNGLAVTRLGGVS